jgi:surface antigen
MSVNIIADNAATICACFGMAGLIVWPVFRARSAMLLTQLAGLIGVSVHYALIGLMTAALVSALGAVQITAALLSNDRRSLSRTGYVVAAMMACTSVVTWRGIASALSGSGMLLITAGRARVNGNSMRLLVLAGEPFWLAHDLMVGSPVAVADALCLILGIGTLAWRHVKVRGLLN